MTVFPIHASMVAYAWTESMDTCAVVPRYGLEMNAKSVSHVVHAKCRVTGTSRLFSVDEFIYSHSESINNQLKNRIEVPLMVGLFLFYTYELGYRGIQK